MELPYGFRGQMFFHIKLETREIQHQLTGISFRFYPRRHLELLSPSYQEETVQPLVEQGAREVLDQAELSPKLW